MSAILLDGGIAGGIELDTKKPKKVILLKIKGRAYPTSTHLALFVCLYEINEFDEKGRGY